MEINEYPKELGDRLSRIFKRTGKLEKRAEELKFKALQFYCKGDRDGMAKIVAVRLRVLVAASKGREILLENRYPFPNQGI